MSSSTQIQTLSELQDVLKRCRLGVLKDYAFGDAEYIWYDQNDDIIAEAYIGSNAEFWTCPPGYWIKSQHPKYGLSYTHGDDYNPDLMIRYSGKDARDLTSYYSSVRIDRNDQG
jgi:hypothetical protein